MVQLSSPVASVAAPSRKGVFVGSRPTLRPQRMRDLAASAGSLKRTTAGARPPSPPSWKLT
jgi:hypothetical protein